MTEGGGSCPPVFWTLQNRKEGETHDSVPPSFFDWSRFFFFFFIDRKFASNAKRGRPVCFAEMKEKLCRPPERPAAVFFEESEKVSPCQHH